MRPAAPAAIDATANTFPHCHSGTRCHAARTRAQIDVRRTIAFLPSVHVSNSRRAVSFSRRGTRPSDARSYPSSNKRAQGMPDAGRTHGPPAAKKQAAVTTGSAETTGIPRAVVLTLISRSPRCAGLFGHRHRRDVLASRSDVEKHHRQLDTSVGVSGPRVFTSATIAVRPSASSRPPHPALRVS
jgi:hypothetical protein